MLNFPQSTEFGKRIPKQKFYENMDVSPAIKKLFADQIKLIYWRNKLAASTLNIAAGETVDEVEVFELRLVEPRLDEDVLKQIDKVIPYNILYILTFDGKAQAWIGYRNSEVNRYFHTDWMPEHELNLKIEGSNMDAIWENLIIQVGGVEVGQGKSLDEQIQIDEQKAKLQKEIEKLEKQARNEKQPNKKFQLAQQAKTLKKQLDEL